LQPNTILFANQESFNIADAALLGLNNTELLTLSACQTAQKTNSDGEGLAGVAYIFERAGVKAVMASLWSVEDKATKQLMIQFYENLKQGMSKGEALQEAKLSQIDKSHPFYWSPFVLIGDAR
jgi:CHAT domain-containing protein